MKFKYIQIKHLWYGYLLVSCLMACNKLDQRPKSSVGKDAVFQSEKGLELYTNSFYSILPTAAEILRGDNMTDYIVRKDVPDFIRPGAFGPRQSTGWTWTDLRNVNYFIENNVNQTIPEEVRNHYNGLARFFRAWFYFEKVKRFGDVPWIGRPLAVDDPGLYRGRDSRTLVMDSVLNDLDYAIDHIQAREDGTRSRITHYVAAAFKSRVCLFEGTFRKYHTELDLKGSADFWLEEAAKAAQIVMEEGNYSLFQGTGESKPYRTLFVSPNPITSEVLLSSQFDEGLAITHDANWYYTSSTYGDRANFSRSFMNTYLQIDGTPFTSLSGYATLPFAEEVIDRDERLSQTIRAPGYYRVNGGSLVAAPPVFSYTYTGYQPIKWVLDDVSYDSGAHNNNVIPIIRYAEVLLNYAEAKAELGSLSDADWNETIGALRRRAGITGNTTSLPTVMDPYLQTTYFPDISDPVLLEVRRERGIELVLEGFRFYDLVRWKRGKLLEMPWNGMYVPALNEPLDLNADGEMDVVFYKTMPNNKIPGVTYVNVGETLNGNPNPMVLAQGDHGEIIWLNTIPRTWQDKFYLYPIPEDDRLINPELGQNPGW